MSIKKGLDEIAALERMFTEEYGKEAARNFRSGWDETKEKKTSGSIGTRTSLNKLGPPILKASRIGSHRICPLFFGTAFLH